MNDSYQRQSDLNDLAEQNGTLLVIQVEDDKYKFVNAGPMWKELPLNWAILDNGYWALWVPGHANKERTWMRGNYTFVIYPQKLDKLEDAQNLSKSFVAHVNGNTMSTKQLYEYFYDKISKISLKDLQNRLKEKQLKKVVEF